MRNHKIKEDTDKISVWCPFDSYPEKKIINQFYARMLIEDLTNLVMPYSTQENNSIKFWIEPTNPEFEKLLLDKLPSDYSHRSDFTRSLIRSIRFIAREISNWGVIAFEYVKYNKGKIPDYEICEINPWTIKDDRDFIVQSVSLKCQREDGYPKEIKIPVEKCFVFKFPIKLGGEKRFKKLLEKMDDTQNLFTKNPLMEKYISGAMSYYNFSEHKEAIDRIHWKMSKGLGWHHRVLLSGNENVNDYYSHYRQLIFKRNALILRDSIISDLGKMIAKIGNKYGYDIKLGYSGITTVDEANEKINKWEIGGMNFEDVSNFIYEQ